MSTVGYLVMTNAVGDFVLLSRRHLLITRTALLTRPTAYSLPLRHALFLYRK